MNNNSVVSTRIKGDGGVCIDLTLFRRLVEMVFIFYNGVMTAVYRGLWMPQFVGRNEGIYFHNLRHNFFHRELATRDNLALFIAEWNVV